MGWASGSGLFGDIIVAVKLNVEDREVRKRIYIEGIRSFRREDWDTEDECRDIDPAFDEALDEENARLGYR